VLIEFDVDGERAGLLPDAPALLALGQRLQAVGLLDGVMTHGGGSYGMRGEAALQAFAEQERSRCVAAAERLRAAGLPCPVVSVGSTPTALSAATAAGVTEVRAGVYAFFDLVMAGLGVCGPEHIAPLVGYLCTAGAHPINGHVFHVEKGRIHTYWYGEEFRTLANDGALFTVDELAQRLPGAVLEGITPVVPPVAPQDAVRAGEGH
jgi:D-serine deaminase-like pyridoxal phosphate-dependent protein